MVSKRACAHERAAGPSWVAPIWCSLKPMRAYLCSDSVLIISQVSHHHDLRTFVPLGRALPCVCADSLPGNIRCRPQSCVACSQEA